MSSKTTTWYFYLNCFVVLPVSIPHKETNIYKILLARIDKAFFDRISLLHSSPSKPAQAEEEERRDCWKKRRHNQLIFCQYTNDTASKCNTLRHPSIHLGLKNTGSVMPIADLLLALWTLETLEISKYLDRAAHYFGENTLPNWKAKCQSIWKWHQ